MSRCCWWSVRIFGYTGGGRRIYKFAKNSFYPSICFTSLTKNSLTRTNPSIYTDEMWSSTVYLYIGKMQLRPWPYLVKKFKSNSHWFNTRSSILMSIHNLKHTCHAFIIMVTALSFLLCLWSFLPKRRFVFDLPTDQLAWGRPIEWTRDLKHDCVCDAFANCYGYTPLVFEPYGWMAFTIWHYPQTPTFFMSENM